jgi:phosphate:Na+ symporter
MECAGAIAREVATLPDGHPGAVPSTPTGEAQMMPGSRTGTPAMPAEQTLGRLQHCASALGELRRAHRSETLGAVANGTFTAGDAVARVEAVRILEALTHHAWRSAAHLIGRANERGAIRS